MGICCQPSWCFNWDIISPLNTLPGWYKCTLCYVQEKGQRSLDMQTSIAMLSLLLGKQWPLYSHFLQYLEVTQTISLMFDSYEFDAELYHCNAHMLRIWGLTWLGYDDSFGWESGMWWFTWLGCDDSLGWDGMIHWLGCDDSLGWDVMIHLTGMWWFTWLGWDDSLDWDVMI